jgi:hypothetical protein
MTDVQAATRSLWLSLGGAAAVILGSLFDWIGRATSWDIPLVGLITHRAEDLVSGIGAGIVLVPVALVAVPLVTHRTLPRWSGLLLGLVSVAVAVAGFALSLDLPAIVRGSVGIGIIVTALGGIALAAGAVVAPHVDSPGKPRLWS